jgi:phosphatidylserine/phosphatidylglycerophosphate/cardiolipin synthase-like enzyme
VHALKRNSVEVNFHLRTARRVAAIVALLPLAMSISASAQQVVTVTIETNFSPYPDGARPIQDGWVRELNDAVSSVRVAMYSFTLPLFKDALIAAQGRGVNVRVVADIGALTRGTAPSCLAVDLYNAGIPIKKYAPLDVRNLLHDKFMVIDETVLVTGSANFTSSAVQFNHENSIIIKANGETPQFIAAFRDQFEAMWSDTFGDFNGFFEDWTPKGTCQ